MNCICVGNMRGGKWEKIYESARRVYSPDGVSPTIHTCGGGNQEIKIMETLEAIVSVGELEELPIALDEQNKAFHTDGTVGCLTTDGSSPKHNNRVMFRRKIRKLTPLECFRLMGFTDDDYYKVKAIGMSDSQIYKQAGNSIVVQVLENIFKSMIEVQVSEQSILDFLNLIK